MNWEVIDNETIKLVKSNDQIISSSVPDEDLIFKLKPNQNRAISECQGKVLVCLEKSKIVFKIKDCAPEMALGVFEGKLVEIYQRLYQNTTTFLSSIDVNL